jgi:hypothetical protein
MADYDASGLGQLALCLGWKKLLGQLLKLLRKPPLVLTLQAACALIEQPGELGAGFSGGLSRTAGFVGFRLPVQLEIGKELHGRDPG